MCSRCITVAGHLFHVPKGGPLTPCEFCGADYAEADAPCAAHPAPDSLTRRIAKLEGDEHELIDRIVARVDGGRLDYGAWHVDADDRDHLTEALEEHLDATIYLAMRLIKLLRATRDHEGNL